jgi:hypothetical protein
VPADKPLFWKAFDAAERAVGPRVEEAVRSGPFLGALGVAAQVQARVRRDVERRSRRLLHLVNLPAASDVAHLRRQVAQLDRELRRVTAALERAEEGGGDGDGPGPRPARRRAQRPAGS